MLIILNHNKYIQMSNSKMDSSGLVIENIHLNISKSHILMTGKH